MNLFNCAGDALAKGLQSSLENLGRLGGAQSYSYILQSLNSAQSNIYVFPTAQAYVNTFNAAGQPNDGLFDQGSNPAAGDTYPNAQMWYTIISELGYGQNVTINTELAAHELGHVVDIAKVDYSAGQPSASSQWGCRFRLDVRMILEPASFEVRFAAMLLRHL